MTKPLPEDFLRYTEPLFGPERFARFMAAMDEEPPVSIRVNRRKEGGGWRVEGGERIVPWCDDGFYLPRRPNFTFDPLLHAGCYYVQEAASQFICHVVKSILPPPSTHHLPPSHVLDLCAAPGGKSTALRSVLPADCLLVSNEPVRQRAQVLLENMTKWGHPGSVVTNCHGRDFVRAGLTGLFDLIVCDVPCSGEGMFRKDPDSIGEWSLDNVMRCQQLQRQIVGDIWPCLRPGGIMIYSTCTYNTKENEENVRWICEQTGADIIAMPTEEEWGITGSLLAGFDAPVYRFIPGLTRSEGLFMAVLRKGDDDGKTTSSRQRSSGQRFQALQPLSNDSSGRRFQALHSKDNNPQPSEALSVTLDRNKYPIVELPYPTAIAYLRREAITLPSDTPKGHVIVAFDGHPLGFVKNIGTRANNLYPREWAIRSSHVPERYEPILASCIAPPMC